MLMRSSRVENTSISTDGSNTIHKFLPNLANPAALAITTKALQAEETTIICWQGRSRRWVVGTVVTMTIGPTLVSRYTKREPVERQSVDYGSHVCLSGRWGTCKTKSNLVASVVLSSGLLRGTCANCCTAVAFWQLTSVAAIEEVTRLLTVFYILQNGRYGADGCC